MLNECEASPRHRNNASLSVGESSPLVANAKEHPVGGIAFSPLNAPRTPSLPRFPGDRCGLVVNWHISFIVRGATPHGPPRLTQPRPFQKPSHNINACAERSIHAEMIMGRCPTHCTTQKRARLCNTVWPSMVRHAGAGRLLVGAAALNALQISDGIRSQLCSISFIGVYVHLELV